MPLSPESSHPDWLTRIEEWTMLRDTLRGSQAIKERGWGDGYLGRTRPTQPGPQGQNWRSRGEAYLPMPEGFKASNDPQGRYEAYLMRAQFPDIVRPTISGIIGVIHRTEALIELPLQLEHLRERATPDGLTLDAFHRLISSEVLLQGRYGVLADLPKDGGDVYLAGYAAETIRNWSEYFHDLYVLDETRYRREGFAWVNHRRFRVLELVDGVYQQSIFEDGPQTSTPTNSNVIGLPTGTGGLSPPPKPIRDEPSDLAETLAVTPLAQGGKTLDALPMVVIGSRDIRDIPDESPMVGVARSALAIYRLDADYRHAMFMTTQDTLVFSGVDEGFQAGVIGAGVWIGLSNPAAKAYYVGTSGAGIGAIRQAITDERLVAVAEGARLFTQQTGGSKAESGEALRLRYSTEAASLIDVAKASAAGLEKALRFAAQLVGADPTSVTVTPNLEFVDVRMTPTDAAALTTVWMQGGMSFDSLWTNFQRGELVDQERDAQDELDLIEKEKPAVAPGSIIGPDGKPIAPKIAPLTLGPDGKPLPPAANPFASKMPAPKGTPS